MLTSIVSLQLTTLCCLKPPHRSSDQTTVTILIYCMDVSSIMLKRKF